MHQLFLDAKKLILDILFPIACLTCSRQGDFLCSSCLNGFGRPKTQVCVICEKPSLLGFTHPRCGSPQMPDVVISFYDYHDNKLSHAIIAGKYYFIKNIYHILGQELVTYLKKELSVESLSDFILVPLPLAKQRERWRGFNQAEILVYELTKNLGLPSENVLLRQKNTRTQKDLDKDNRKSNVHNAFILRADANVKGKSYMLVDDVVTTGATLIEAAKVLKRNGANKVWCVTVARD